MDKASRTITIEMTEPTRTNYLTALRFLGDCPNWSRAVIGVLKSEVSGSGTHWTAMSHAPHDAGQRPLQTHDEASAEAVRKKAIATMRAWVVRNIQDDASRAKAETMARTKAEDRALVLFTYPRRSDQKLIRYRGGWWARPGLKTDGPGELPEPAPHTGIAILRKLAAKGYVVLDEVKGEATLN